MLIINPEMEKYMIDLVPKRDTVLQEMEAFGEAHDFPLIGPLCGQFLQQMSIAIRAKNIFEMGSGFGYSAIWFARAIPEDGKVICTDGDSENRVRALENFKRAGVAHKIEFHVGNAQEILQKYSGPFDIIFNDIDKHEYPETIDLVASRLRKGGLFITDNVLWDAKVANPPDDKYTRGIQEFNRLMYQRKDFLNSIIPLRDGLMLSVKI